jgi:hypothetical protein
MSAQIYLHPSAVDYAGLLTMLSKLKDHGYDVPSAQRGKFYRAVPEPKVVPLPVSPAHRRRTLNFWSPKS